MIRKTNEGIIVNLRISPNAKKNEIIKDGDIITIIGEDKNITAEQVADKADTITNELLCRLGDRLARIIV